jgi:hypothetical protein
MPEPTKFDFDALGVSVSIFRSERDGKVIVQIDTDCMEEGETPEGEPIMRVYLNDGTLHDGTRWPQGHQPCQASSSRSRCPSRARCPKETTMDPTVTLADTLAALHGIDDPGKVYTSDEHRAQAIEGLRDLADWLEKGGRAPGVECAVNNRFSDD